MLAEEVREVEMMKEAVPRSGEEYMEKLRREQKYANVKSVCLIAFVLVVVMGLLMVVG